jgi:lantibiotic biosynthesis protein
VKWRSLLDRPQAQKARDVIARVCADEAAAEVPGPGNGELGVAVALEAGGADAAVVQRRAERGLAVGPHDGSLYRGAAGLTWAQEALAGDGEDPAARWPEWLEQHAAELQQFDLVNGWVGVLVAVLRRAHRPGFERLAALCFSQLASRAQRDPNGAYWSAGDSRGVDLGVAHGVTGVLWALAVCARARVAGAEALYRDAARWLLAQREPEGRPQVWSDLGGTSAPRVAWCAGDLGMAAVLHQAARAMDDRTLEAAALKAASCAAELSSEPGQIVALGLCHGAAGAAHLLNRLWQRTGNEAFGARARELFEGVLQATAGPLPEWQLQRTGVEQAWASSPGVLDGYHGVMLALHAATSSKPPGWDDLLLLETRWPASS